MRCIFYIFLVSQLFNFLGVFAEKKNLPELETVNWEKVKGNKPEPLKKIIWKSYTEDENFFKNNNYNKEVDTSRPDIVKIIMNLKKYWDEIGEANRNTIWLYFQVMIKLVEKL